MYGRAVESKGFSSLGTAARNHCVKWAILAAKKD